MNSSDVSSAPAPPRPSAPAEPSGAPGAHGRAGPPGAARRRPVLDPVARVAGTALGGLSGLVGRVRVRPLHPDGIVLAGRIHRTGPARGGRPSGVAWIDDEGADDVVVRLSRGGGLPYRLPDVLGLAFTGPDGDVLLSTAVAGLPGLRHVPCPRFRHGTATYTSLVSYQGPHGLVMVGARPRAGARRLPARRAGLVAELGRAPVLLDLVWATPSSRWQTFGALAIMATTGLAADRGVRFDPFRAPDGLTTQRWVRGLREPAYAAARRHPSP